MYVCLCACVYYVALIMWAYVYQWCTTFFDQGLLFDFLNSSGASTKPTFDECNAMLKTYVHDVHVRNKTQSNHKDYRNSLNE